MSLIIRLVSARDGALLSGGERLAPTEPAGETSNRSSTRRDSRTNEMQSHFVPTSAKYCG